MESAEFIRKLHEFCHLADPEKIDADCRKAYEEGYSRGHADGIREEKTNSARVFGKDV